MRCRIMISGVGLPLIGLGRVDKFDPDADAGKQHERGEALDQLVIAGGDAA